MIFKKKHFKYLIIPAFLILLSSCSVWENFTTYFNLYYNTATLFNDTENDILAQQKDLFSNDPLVVSGASKTSLIKVIEKCSKLLQFNANSSYVDEALMMLGKAFFYQGNYQKANRKFEELLATNPGDEESLEANFWIAKCLFALRENSEASQKIGQIRKKAVEEGYDDLIKDSYVEEIKYWLREQNIPRALSLTNEFADVYDDGVTRAQVYYELGKLYTQLEDKENAIKAFSEVFEYSPDFDLEIAATIDYADALRDGGQYETALNVFQDLRDKDKFKNSFNQIDFEIGKTLVQLQRYDEAMLQFRMVDSVYKNSSFATASNFEMANLYQNQFGNYDSAAYYYSKSVSNNAPKEYIEKARNNNQLFARYVNLRRDINKYNKQLFYTENPEIFLIDSSAYSQDSLKILNDYLAKKELQDIWKDAATLQGKDTATTKDSTFIKDSLAVRDSLVKLDSLVQIGLYNAKDTVGLRQKLLDNIKQKILLSEKEKSQKNLASLQSKGQVKLDTVKFKRNPPLKLKIPIDSAKTLLAKNSLELGNLFLAELNIPDSARILYETILDKYPVQSYYPNTIYALGSYYLTVNNKPKADSLFRIIYDNYKDKSIVNAAADKLNLPFIDLSFDSAKDIYASAEQLMLDSNYEASLNKFYSIYKDYPKSSYAPKALYASGWVLENNLMLLDSAASVYELVAYKYPTSVYVKEVMKKITTYKQEKARIQKAIQDSLATLEKLKNDSTVVTNNNVADDENKNSEEKGLVSDDVKNNVPVNNQNVAQVNNINGHKKLEPLWDPRKHFQ